MSGTTVEWTPPVQHLTWAESKLKELPRETVLFTIVRHVSRSGASKVVDVLVFEDGEPVWLRQLPLLGRRFDGHHGGLIVRGTGLDASSALVSEIGRTYHDDPYYFERVEL